jgi:TRAP-type C4-dicarboxylate transport system permease small subunit
VAAVGITCQMIWVRFVLNGSTVWQTEMVVYLVIAATLVGLPYVQRLRGHVNVDLVPLALPPRARRVMALVTLTLSIAVVCVMLFYGFEFWHFAWDRNWKSDTVWGVRLWIPYMAIPVGFGLFLLQLVADLVALLTGVEKPFGLADDAGLTDRGPEDASPQAEDAMAPAPDPDPAAPARAAQDFSDDKKGTR